MAKPGPKPVPTHLKVVRGERKDRINTNEPKPNSAEPKCPSWLSPDAKRVFKRTATQLRLMGILFEADIDLITAYANAVVNYQKATEVVDQDGILVEGRRDGLVSNPAVRIQRDAATLIRMLASELGLTPSSRSRLSAGNDDAADNILD
jgi:P27 family predicted phage terminase small subunit